MSSSVTNVRLRNSNDLRKYKVDEISSHGNKASLNGRSGSTDNYDLGLAATEILVTNSAHCAIDDTRASTEIFADKSWSGWIGVSFEHSYCSRRNVKAFFLFMSYIERKIFQLR